MCLDGKKYNIQRRECILSEQAVWVLGSGISRGLKVVQGMVRFSEARPLGHLVALQPLMAVFTPCTAVWVNRWGLFSWALL